MLGQDDSRPLSLLVSPCLAWCVWMLDWDHFALSLLVSHGMSGCWAEIWCQEWVGQKRKLRLPLLFWGRCWCNSFNRVMSRFLGYERSRVQVWVLKWMHGWTDRRFHAHQPSWLAIPVVVIHHGTLPKLIVGLKRTVRRGLGTKHLAVGLKASNTFVKLYPHTQVVRVSKVWCWGSRCIQDPSLGVLRSSVQRRTHPT